MRMLAGPDSRVMFTSLSKTSCDFIDASFGSKSGTDLAAFSCHREGIVERMKAEGIPLDKVCLLDPKAESELSPEDGDGRFEWFLFGVRLLDHYTLLCGFIDCLSTINPLTGNTW